MNKILKEAGKILIQQKTKEDIKNILTNIQTLKKIYNIFISYN